MEAQWKGCSTDAVWCRLYTGHREGTKSLSDCFCCLFHVFKSLRSQGIWISLGVSPVHRFRTGLFVHPSLFSFSLWSLMFFSLRCYDLSGHLRAALCMFSCFVLENRKIMPKDCLCIWGHCVREWGRHGALIVRCYICCGDKLWCCILWLGGVGVFVCLCVWVFFGGGG